MDTEKNVDRVLLLLNDCGCTPTEALYVLEEVKLELIKKQRAIDKSKQKKALSFIKPFLRDE